MTVQEVAACLKLSRTSAYRTMYDISATQGEGAVVKLGPGKASALRVRTDAFRRYLEAAAL